MSIRIQPAKFGHSAVPNVQGYTPNASLTLLRGAPVTFDVANDELIEFPGTTTVTDLLGFALADCTAGVSDSPDGQVLVAKAKNQEFAGQCIASAAVVTDLSSVVVGTDYGLLKDSDGQWYVDLDDETNVVAMITRVDDDLDIVWFRIIDSAVQDL